MLGYKNRISLRATEYKVVPLRLRIRVEVKERRILAAGSNAIVSLNICEVRTARQPRKKELTSL